MISARAGTGAVSWLVPAVLALGGVSALAADATTTNKPKPDPWSFRLRAGAEATYDDNILMLSEREKDLVDSSDPNNESRFGVSQPEDVIFEPSVGFVLSRAPRRGRETEISVTARARRYVENSVKDYEEYGVSLRQELNRSRGHRTRLRVGGSLIPSYFLRQLSDEDESTPSDACRTGIGTCVHNAADFERTRAYIEVSQEIVNRFLSATAGYARERRDYNDHFNERDANSDVVTLDVDVYPTGRIAFRIRPYYEHERRDSRGDVSSSTVVDDDVGFDSDLYGLELRGLWGPDENHRNTLRGYYQMERRDFTTDNTGDTGHFDREDDISRFGVSFAHEMGPSWEWGAFAYRRDVDVSISSSEFQKSVVGASLGYRFERRFSREASR